jgi:hypothetical protein
MLESQERQPRCTALCEYIQKTSPVLDILRHPVPVSIEMVD